jgi:hypothetical protein
MSIESNAAPDELDSPFYKKNEELCKKWEQFILERGGQVKGSYNAWSFIFMSKVKGKKEWLINVKKATFTSGNLLLSSKKQSLQEILTFRSIFKNTGCKDFHISRSIFKRKERNHPFFKQIELLVKNGINDRSLYEVQFKNSELNIIFHHKNDWFEMADKVLAFEYTV